MLLAWLICHLSIATAIPLFPPPAFTRSWRITNTINETGAYLDHSNHDHKICITASCFDIATKILVNRDITVDPCENFYQYACGSWSKHNPIPKNKLEWSEDHMVIEKTQRRIRDALEESDSPDDIPPVKMARKLYRSCMDIDAIEERGIKPILEILEQHGGWPLAMPAHQWDSERINWQKLDKQYITLIGNSAFYNLEYDIDANNTKRYILTLDQDTEYPLAKRKRGIIFFDDPSEDPDMPGLLRVVEAFAKEKGYYLNLRRVTSDIVDMLHFQVELVEILDEGKENIGDTTNYKRMSIKQLQEWYDDAAFLSSTAKIDFLEVLQYAVKLVNVTLDSSEPILVYNPEFLQKLAKLLAKTPQRVLVNYVQWNMIDKFLQYTTQKMRDVRFNAMYRKYNISNNVPRWQICVDEMRMKNAVSYMFIKRYISDHVLHEATRMVKKIKEEQRRRIEQAHWLSSSAKMAMLQKVDGLIAQVGYSEWHKDGEAITQHYKGLHIGSDYFQNILNCAHHELLSNLLQFKDVVTRDQWIDYPITVNAFYGEKINTILIPAAELQDPFFTPSLPDAVNYGTTGFVIGHELSHGFDNKGIQFDKEGHEILWYPQRTLSEYKKRSKCFVDQFSNYTLDIKNEEGRSVKLDGKLTQGENIADSIGIQIAYSAFKKVAKQKNQTRLPGLEHMSSEELFFLSFANSWCSSIMPEYDADTLNSDEHSPAKYRIIGSLSNMPSFAKVFKCPENSPMNRHHKCNLWD